MAHGKLISGVVDLGGVGKFNVRVLKFSEATENQQTGRQGRGQGRWRKTRPFTPGSTLALIGQVQNTAPPFPSDFRGEIGSLVVYGPNNISRTYSVRIDAGNISYDETKDDTWKLTLTCTVLALPTSSGFQLDAPTATADPVATTVELYDGTVKTQDPSGIQNDARRVYDVWPVATDTDAEELAQLAICIAKSVPFTGMKLRTGSVVRTDSHGIRITCVYGQTTPAEDEINSRSRVTTDPDYLTNEATTAAFDGDPPAPPGDYWVHTTTTTLVISGKTLTVWAWGMRSIKEGIEQDGSKAQLDTWGIVTQHVICRVTDSEAPPTTPTAPTGTTLYNITTQKTNSVPRYRHLFEYRPADSAELIEFEGTLAEYDPTNLTDEEKITVVVSGTSTPPPPAATMTNVKLLRRTGPRAFGRNTFAWTFIYGLVDPKERIEFGGSAVIDDPNDLRRAERVTSVTTSATPPSFTSTLGLKLRNTESRKLTGQQWQHTAEFGERNTLDELLMDVTRYSRDIVEISDEDFVAVNSATSTPPAATAARSGLQHVETTSRQVKDGTWLHVFRYTRATAIEKIIADGTSSRRDPNSLESSATVTEVNTDDVPTFPSAPLGDVVPVESITRAIPGTELNIHQHRFGVFDSKQAIEARGTTGGYHIDGTARSTQATVIDSGSDPDTVAYNLMLSLKGDSHFREVQARKVAPGKIETIVQYGQLYHLIHARFWNEFRQMPAVLNNGLASVRMTRKLAIGTEMDYIYIEPEWQNVIWGVITLTTLRLTTTEYSFQTYLSKMGLTNANTFLTFPSTFVKYIGALPSANLGIPLTTQSGRWDRHSYEFLYCSAGHFTPIGVKFGWDTTMNDLSLYNAGDLVPVSVLGWPAAIVPATSSFSVFLP